MKYLILLSVMLSGCTAVGYLSPSVSNCTDVEYVRHGADVTMVAKCLMPNAAQSPVEIPLPKVGA